ncbi:MAG: Isoleucine--tRNA ligase [Chlamydiia bacterium]|nr:Isoleucine--tRNA ligase [Chlamydiia bacterium]MCH9615297.1 Isoleucine--tRNA ligase [Chlamydiia bacterium]MCH9628381.1 Isoleucine--tRNA ligase [Chlamydiia bacterium]
MFEVNQLSFSKREEKVLKIWEEKGIFLKSVEHREKGPVFSFYDGPPFATGLPHYGHLLAGTIKDVVPRYKTMRGFKVTRRFGWDCHGLPVENEIEKAKELSGGPEIEQFGIANFNEECRSIVQRYVKEWESTVARSGRWVDFSRTWKTMDPEFMESVWWVFSELWNKGLVYEGFKVMPFSAKLGTPLSNFEANLNYQDVDDPSLTVKFPLVDGDASLLVWTTTPWTLISNLAATVNANMDYVKVKAEGENYILAKSRVGAHFKEGEFEVLEEFKGDKLKGLRYEPPMDYFADHPNGFQVLVDDFVGEDDGTGIVHTAPAFGEADFFVCLREKIEIVCPVNHNGQFTSEIPEYEGQFVKDADKAIIKRLKEAGKVFKHTQIRHRYPFCWRSDTPLIYKAMTTWFVSVEKIKDRLLANNEQIHWVPNHIKHGRFGKWLENARDWAISRNRYWGTPIPLWISDEGDVKCISSIQELEEKTGKKIDDIHRHFIDELTFEEDGKVYKRIPEVFDCWFESGSMPYAQNHYPFENEETTMDRFPADFIAEGLDQTRGWFYTLTVLSTALFDKPAFKNCIVNGIILAEDGNKMSKRLKNYPDPTLMFDKYGADAVRLFLLYSPVVQGDDLKFSERGVELVLRRFLLPMWNSYVFLATYAKIYNWKAQELQKTPTAEIDRWILSRLQKLIREVELGMDRYELSKAVDPFTDFIDALTNWYIRRSRPRFWADEETPDRNEAFETLYTVLLALTKIAAPFVPFLSDAIYMQLSTVHDSVHLTDYPEYDETLRDAALEDEMSAVQTAVSMGHMLRKENKLKVRQPLKVAYLISSEQTVLDRLANHTDLIADELNVKEVAFSSDEGEFVSVSLKPNYPALGKKLGPKMKLAKSLIENLAPEQVGALLDGATIEFEEIGPITLDQVLVERKVKEDVVASTEGGITIVLETALDEALILEGLARELVNKVNTLRKSENFEVTDRISIKIETTDQVRAAYDAHKDYICHEILAKEVQFSPNQGEALSLNGEPTTLTLNKL